MPFITDEQFAALVERVSAEVSSRLVGLDGLREIRHLTQAEFDALPEYDYDTTAYLIRPPAPVDPPDPPEGGVYETWPGAAGAALPSERWQTAGYGGTAVEQTGDGFARLAAGTAGNYNGSDGTPIRSVEEFPGEVRYQLRWQSSIGEDVALQAAFCVSDSGGLNPWDVYPVNGYYLVFNLYSSTFFLARRVGGSGSAIVTGQSFTEAGLTPAAPGVVWNVAVAADGTTVRAWLWDEGDARPGTPTFQATDSTYSSGKIRFTVPPSFAGGGEVHIGQVEYDVA